MTTVQPPVGTTTTLDDSSTPRQRQVNDFTDLSRKVQETGLLERRYG